jgi:hypothetical protein
VILVALLTDEDLLVHAIEDSFFVLVAGAKVLKLVLVLLLGYLSVIKRVNFLNRRPPKDKLGRLGDLDGLLTRHGGHDLRLLLAHHGPIFRIITTDLDLFKAPLDRLLHLLQLFKLDLGDPLLLKLIFPKIFSFGILFNLI